MSVVDVRDLGAELCALNAKLDSIQHKRDLFDSQLNRITVEEAALREKLLNQRKQIAAAEEAAAASAASSAPERRKGRKDAKPSPNPAIRRLLKKKVPRDSGVLVSLSQFQPLLDQLPSGPRVPPIVDTLSGVHTIQGPGFSDATVKMGDYAAGRTITTYPYVADRSHRVCN